MARADRERQLLDIAEGIFAEKGYLDATVDDIARTAGVTKPVIYDHFGSKEGLAAAVVARSQRVLIAATSAAYAAMPPGSSHEDYLRAGVRTFLDHFATRQQSFRVYQQQPAAMASAFSEIEAMRLAQAGDIEVRISYLPGLTDVAPEVRLGMAEVVMAALERVTAWAQRHPEHELDTQVDLVMGVLWGGLSSFLDPAASPNLPTAS